MLRSSSATVHTHPNSARQVVLRREVAQIAHHLNRHAVQAGGQIPQPGPQILPVPEPERATDQLRAVEDTFRILGANAAMRGFATDLDIDPHDREPDAPLRAPGPDHLRNVEVLLTYDLPAIRAHQLDMAALKATRSRIVVAGGEASGHVWTHTCAAALAAWCPIRVNGRPHV